MHPHVLGRVAATFALAVLISPPSASPGTTGDGTPDLAVGRDEADPPARPRPTRVGRTVFVCADALPVTFADRPCSAGAEQRQLRVLEPPPGRAPSLSPAAGGASTRPAAQRPAAAPGALDPNAERCRRLLAQRESLNDRMRAGYTARQAGQLWNRWRDLGREIYAARC